MKNETSKKSTALDAVPKLVSILKGLLPEDQKRAISAAMILLGGMATPGNPTDLSHIIEPTEAGKGISPKAGPWLRKNAITRESLDHIFLIDDESIEVIAATMPGKGKRQQTIQAYLICGLQNFLGSGDVAFSDKQARNLCTKIGCYDGANHASYMKDFGNWISGSKDSGWKLTNPGLNEAARIVKHLVDHPEA